MTVDEHYEADAYYRLAEYVKANAARNGFVGDPPSLEDLAILLKTADEYSPHAD